MFSKNVVSRVDPYAIQEMEFNIKKASKYTTIKSLICTLIIFTLTILISLDSLSNLWKDRKDLPINRLDQVKLPLNPLSDTPICFQNLDSTNSAIPEVVATNSANQTIVTLTQDQVQSQFPQIRAKMSSDKYKCFNLKGITLYPDFENMTMFSIDMITRVWVKLLSEKQIIFGQAPEFIGLDINSNADSGRAQMLLLPQSRFVMKDQLAVNYDPDILTGFGNNGYMTQGVGYTLLPRPSLSQTLLLFDISRSTLQKDNVVQYTVIRENIGQIIGKFFAWYSLFLLVFVIVMNPVVQFGLNIELSKTLYSNETLSQLEPSIFIQVKYYLSFIFTRFFKERILSKSFQKLQQDMDLSNLLKKQVMMKKISKQTRYSQAEIELFTPDFQKDKSQEKQLLEKPQDSDSEQEESQTLNSTFQYQSQQTQSRSIKSIVQLIFTEMDMSETEVGLVYNKGAPIGSFFSILVTVLGVSGLITILILTGILTIQTDVSYFTEVSSFQSDRNSTFSISRGEILFQVKPVNTHFISYELKFFYLNNDLVPLDQIRMDEGSNCSDMADYFDVEIKSYHFCIPQTKQIDLFNTGSEKNYLGIFTIFNTTNTSLWSTPISNLYTREYIFSNSIVSMVKKTSRYDIAASRTHSYTLNRISFEDQIENNTFQSFFTYGSSLYQSDLRLNGSTFSINPVTKKAIRQSSSIWDMIDNTWGIVILVFEVFIIKLCKIINKQIKKNQSSSQKQKERSNIISILSNHDRLQNNSFKKELETVKYYFKENIKLSEIGY